jgi:hypothetical protein
MRNCAISNYIPHNIKKNNFELWYRSHYDYLVYMYENIFVATIERHARKKITSKSFNDFVFLVFGSSSGHISENM